MRLRHLPMIASGAGIAALLLPSLASAQCAACRSALVNSPEGQQLASGFNSGILFLLSAPFLITGVMALLIIRPAQATAFLPNSWARFRRAIRSVAPRAKNKACVTAEMRAELQCENLGNFLPGTHLPLPVDPKAGEGKGANIPAPPDPRIPPCRNCRARLSERHIVLRKSGEEERALAVYKCPACGLQWESVPDLDALRAWEILAMGAALQAQGRSREALACFDRALAINPSSAMGWYNRGCVLGDLGLFEEAIRSYALALDLDRNHADAWHNMGHALRRLGNFTEALDCYRCALLLNPGRAATWVNTGDLLLVLNRPEGARNHYDQALRLEAQNARAWLGKGCAQGQLRQMQEAIACFDQALTLDAQDAETWSKKGNSLCMLGRFEEALHCYEQALALDPQNAVAEHNQKVLANASRCVQ